MFSELRRGRGGGTKIPLSVPEDHKKAWSAGALRSAK